MQAGIRARLRAGALGLAVVICAGQAGAEAAWVQIQALPTLDQAEGRLRELSSGFPDIAGFALAGGWYGIALGPYPSPEAAQAALATMRAQGRIPGDSYIADPKSFRNQFWPVGATLSAQGSPTPPEARLPPALAPEAQVETLPETLSDSRRLEAALTREQRMEIQSALQWLGFYSEGIDGAFGPGTRGSISAWQQSQGAEPTGVLSSAQQAQLLERAAQDRAQLGIAPVDEPRAGISIDLPLGLVEFDHYDPPFVHYRARDDSGVQVLLISEPGDQNALFGLYDAMQTLAIVPQDGPRERSKTGFRITGTDARIHSVTEVGLSKGLIKGFTIVYPAADEARMARVVAAMRASFRPVGDSALDPTLGQPMAVSRADLIGGLEVRHPEFARSGFFISHEGAVLTAAEGLDQCGRVTIEGLPAQVAFSEPDLGLAVLKPKTALAPPAVAAFETGTPGAGTAIVVAGYSYPEALPAPVLNFGTLSDLNGLAGEPALARLAVTTLAGDAGGPVMDQTGAVAGVVLPRGGDENRLLPAEMTVAVQATALVPVLAENGFAPLASDSTQTLAAEDLSVLARGFTVQVECWK